MTQHLKKLSNTYTIMMSVITALALQGCFTGIEYTPTITYKDVKKEKIKTSEEQAVASGFSPENFSDWKSGKEFYVTDDKIGWIINGTSELHRGDTLVYAGCRNTMSLTGGEARYLSFINRRNPADTVITRLTAPTGQDAIPYRIPFTIEMSVIDSMRKALAGNRYFIKTNIWYDRDGDTRKGRKFIPVTITEIRPFLEEYAAIVTFKDESGNSEGNVLMSQNDANSIRGFETLFSLANPRLLYPEVTDANWTAIQNSRVNDGMTRAEVQASLGTPATIDRGHNQSAAYERWIYQDGITLVFIDGILHR